MPRPLKVFRTPIGFHDAYVATPSRAAALRAWGSDVDLFARGMAEEVTDAGLTRAPLADPGAVIRVARGTVAEHLATLPATPKAAPSPTPRQRPPRPSKATLLAARDAASEAAEAFDAQDRDLIRREQQLATERRRFDRDRAATLARLQRDVDDAEAHYQEALAGWAR